MVISEAILLVRLNWLVIWEDCILPFPAAFFKMPWWYNIHMNLYENVNFRTIICFQEFKSFFQPLKPIKLVSNVIQKQNMNTELAVLLDGFYAVKQAIAIGGLSCFH